MDTNSPAASTDPGVHVARRSVLHGLWAAPAALGLARWSRGRQDGGESGPVDAFLKEWSARAEALASAGEPNEDEHLFELCAALTRLAPGVFPGRRMDAYDADGLKTGPIHNAGPFLVLELELEPGAVIRPHNHVGWNFASLCVEGELAVRHYEVEPGAPTPDVLERDFHVREVLGARLTPGRTSTLTRTRANIHAFRAGERGARMIDFGVNFGDPGEGPQVFSVLDVQAEAADPAARVHGARWLGNIYK